MKEGNFSSSILENYKNYYKGKLFSDFPMKFCNQIGRKIVKDIDIKDTEKIKGKMNIHKFCLTSIKKSVSAT